MFVKIKNWLGSKTVHNLSVSAFIVCAVVTMIFQARELSETKRELANLNLELNSQVEKLNTYVTDALNTEHELDVLKGSVQILDGAVNADKKRKVRITKVRDVIKQEISNTSGRALDPVQLAELSSAIIDNCDEYDVPVPLLMGVIRQESAFNVHAVSKKGAQGLTQVMPTTAEDIKAWLGRSYYDPFKISHNIKFGTYYLSRMLRKFNYNQSNAVLAYNGGPENVFRFLAGDIPKLYPETVDYEKQVMAYAKEFEALGIN